MLMQAQQVVSEACGDRSKLIQQQNLFDIDASIGDVVDEAEAIRHLAGPNSVSGVSYQ